MKKTLIALLICLSVLTVFISCVLWPKEVNTKTITVYTNDGEVYCTFKVPLEGDKKWSDYSKSSPYSSCGKNFYYDEGFVFHNDKLVYSDSEGNDRLEDGLIKDCPSTLYINSR